MQSVRFIRASTPTHPHGQQQPNVAKSSIGLLGHCPRAFAGFAGAAPMKVAWLVTTILALFAFPSVAQMGGTLSQYCHYTHGLKAGNIQHFPMHPPAPLGVVCNDGVASWGIVVAPPAPPPAGGCRHRWANEISRARDVVRGAGAALPESSQFTLQSGCAQ